MNNKRIMISLELMMYTLGPDAARGSGYLRPIIYLYLYPSCLLGDFVYII